MPPPPPANLTPADLIAAWPADHPLACIWSTGPAGWAIFAAPTQIIRLEAAQLDQIDALTQPTAPPTPLPFNGGWIAALPYEPGITLLRCPGAWLFNRTTGQWHAAGDVSCLPDLNESNNLPSTQQRAATVKKRNQCSHENEDRSLTVATRQTHPPPYTLAPLTSRTGRPRYEQQVRLVLDYIEAGDVYQANIAHHLTAAFSGSTRAFFADLAQAADPQHGAYLETPGQAICSISPELFLDYDPTDRTITTRPMKGTRPLGSDPQELHDAAKDRAELAMIVDLMRNDLGRVCDFGSIRVSRPRDIEPHAGSVLQATATVTGRLRNGLGLGDLLRASFPPGSVTGAPKIRAMQIINELEPAPRGFYCGSIGYISDCGRAQFNVAIRTATIKNGTLAYPVGAGIVADSDPSAEWEETLVKSEVLRRLCVEFAPSVSEQALPITRKAPAHPTR